MRGFSHRSRMLQLGYRREDFIGKPVIAIVNTWSEINPCHAHLRERAEAVKRGVWQAGGFPVEIPAFSITEIYMKPSPMLYRNLLAMDTEEALRSLPIDGAVLMGGCDKTTPGLLMGAISVNLPAIYLPAGPMLRGNWNGQALGSGTDVWKYWTERCAGDVTRRRLERHRERHRALARFLHDHGHRLHHDRAGRSARHDAAGRILDSGGGFQSRAHGHGTAARASSRWCGRMRSPRTFSRWRPSANAITVDMAIGGSTNAIIHLVALARRCGFDLPLPLFDEISRHVPVLANIRPSGEFLMEDFYYAGGLRALMARDPRPPASRLPHGQRQDARRESGRRARSINRNVIRGRDANRCRRPAERPFSMAASRPTGR